MKMGPSDFGLIWTLVAMLLTMFTSNVMAAGYFELQILEISNTNSHLLSGYCCGVPLDKKNSKTTGCSPCSTAFRLCLKEHQTTITPDSGVFTGCSFGNASTSVLGGSSFVLSDPEVGTIVLPFTFSWTKSFTLILQAVDFYNATYPISEQLIEETSYSGLILPSLEWNTLDHIGKNARITYRIRVQCQTNYYNVTCQTFCRPRNDNFGHYTCSDKGSKVCLPGWQGTNCEKAICKPGCDSVHGKCDQPGECECRSGWRGPLCNECTVYPGCRHGYCNGSAWQCICDTNWGGILCDQDLNYCGTHEPCMHGGTCENTAPDQFRCTCAEGLSGIRCEVVEHPCATHPCKNAGTCTLKDPGKYESSASQIKPIESQTQPIVLRGMRGMSSMGKPVSSRLNEQRDVLGLGAKSKSPVTTGNNKPNIAEFTCSCAPGWTGSTCEINIDECSGGPCEHGGTCIDLVGGFRCECLPQWSGELCNVDVNECDSNVASLLGPCINADRCINTPGSFQCNCLNGWGGPICDKNIDDCVGQCKNGATCIDLVNNYHCACVPGYTGHNCSEDIDECASSPCGNDGECINLLGKFKCICPVGYSGTLCEEAKNHCAPSPCVEGKCLNTPDGYYCRCPPTRSGNQCELIVPPCESPPCNNGCIQPSNVSRNPIACNGHGKCESAPNGIGKQCVCHSGFTGLYCQHNLNECSPNPCKNGGICSDGDDDFTCECTSGWSGKICTEIATQCQSGQCLNGGTCVSKLERHARCHCTTGWGGPFCADQVNECEGQPCHNGGTCVPGPGWFRCDCARGFSGVNCRINVNECSPMPCLGGSTCKDGIGGFTCICPPGRKGNRCEILLSDPSSVCMNTSSLSPYISLQDLEDKSDNQTVEFNQDDVNCNFCICKDHQPICSNIWCGLPNCFVQNEKANNTCKSNEVCLPNSQETCLSPPCDPRGDCRKFESSRSVAPPNIPVPTSCWPNQAILGELCARISILLETNRIPKKSSVESICLNLRSVLAARIVRSDKNILTPLLVLLCDIKNGTNDTIELTVSTTGKGPNAVAAVSEAVKLLGEILSRQKAHVKETLVSLRDVEAASLSAIVEVKVETALITTETQGSGVFVIASFIIAIIALCLGAFGALMWRKRISSRTNSGINLSPQSQEEEKSNNLQNEENFRRYANPLKGSVTSLRGAMELSLSPAPEIATIGSLAGPSALHRSQPLFPPCDNDFDPKRDQHDNNQTKSHRGSQILLYKAQNPDIRKNTVGSIENSHKDFGKRSINCQAMSPVVSPGIEGDILTVHV